jgi:hypothetical protein
MDNLESDLSKHAEVALQTLGTPDHAEDRGEATQAAKAALSGAHNL